MKQNVKRSFCLLLALVMCLGLLSGIAVPMASAEGASLLQAPDLPATQLVSAPAPIVPDDAIFVNTGWTQDSTPASYTFSGKSFDLTFGTNAFAAPADAISAAAKGGTVVLTAGTYSSAITVTKSLTLLGEKAGIDPNVRGTTATDDWTMNPARGTNETIVKATLNLGVNGATVYADAEEITVDGITVSGGGNIRSNNGNTGSCKINLYNLILDTVTATTETIYFAPYYPTSPKANLYVRDVTVCNMRVIQQQKANVFALCADKADIGGVYMDENSTKVFINALGTSDGSVNTGAASICVHDSMFRAPANRLIYADFNTATQLASNTVNANIASRSRVDFRLNGCVFYNVGTTSTSNKWVVACRPETQNVYYDFSDNIFYQTNPTASGFYALGAYTGSKGAYGDQIAVKGNRFLGFTGEFSFSTNNTVPVDMSGNLTKTAGGEIVALRSSASITQDYWYVNEDMTETNTGVTVPASAVFVGTGWTEGNTPATYRYLGRPYALSFGTNAFATVSDAMSAAPKGGTVILTAGSYGGFNITKSLTILGEKAGIDPNVKGAAETDDWTVNPNRGTNETVLTGNTYLGNTSSTVYADAKDITIDGVTVSGTGNFRSNNGNTGSCKFTFKNIIVGNCTTYEPFYMAPYYPTGGAVNSYVRDITMQNIRISGLTSKNVLIFSADKLDASGIYMASNCTKQFFSAAGTSDGAVNPGAVTHSVHDSMFRCPVQRVMYFSYDPTGSIASKKVNQNVSQHSSVTVSVSNNVFYNAASSATSGSKYIVAFRPDTTNVSVSVTGNTFYQTTQTVSDFYPVAGYSGNPAEYSVTVNRNKFIGFDQEFTFGQNQALSDVTGNYTETLGGEVVALRASGTVKQDYWYTNPEMTETDDGEVTIDVPEDQLYDLANEVKFFGRTYESDGATYFNWTNAGFEFNFKGTAAQAILVSEASGDSAAPYISIYVDGELLKYVKLTSAVRKEAVTLAENLTDTYHTIRVVKRTNTRSSSAGLKYLWINEGGKKMPRNAVSTRKMQFVGDSITVGYGTLGQSGESWSVDTEDGTLTCGAITANYFGAENNTIAVSGRGIVKNTGGDTTDLAPAMYEFTDWNNRVQWDHSKYVPDVIVINYGTNDNSSNGPTIDDATFYAGCKAFVEQVRADNPTSKIIYAYGFMGERFVDVVKNVVKDLNDAGDDEVYYLRLAPVTSSEKTVAGHPSAAANADRAEDMIAKVAEITGWTEDTHEYQTSVLEEGDCTHVSVDQKLCPVCGKKLFVDGTALAHEWGDAVTVTAATVASTGLARKTCQHCPATEDTVLPKLASDLFAISITPGTISADPVNDGYLVIKWQLNLDINSESALNTDDHDISVTQYGILCAAKEKTLTDYMNGVTSGKIIRNDFGSVAGGPQTKVYKTTDYQLTKVSPERDRYAVCFIEYEVDGESTVQYTLIDLASTRTDLIDDGEGSTQSDDDGLDD